MSPEQVASRPLFGAERDGRLYGLLQVWYGGDAQVLALMVVPEPRAGQVLSSPDRVGEPVAVPDQGTEAAVLIERPAGATGDRLLVLDGNGDPERPVVRGTVEELLAASSS